VLYLDESYLKIISLICPIKLKGQWRLPPIIFDSKPLSSVF